MSTPTERSAREERLKEIEAGVWPHATIRDGQTEFSASTRSLLSVAEANWLIAEVRSLSLAVGAGEKDTARLDWMQQHVCSITTRDSRGDEREYETITFSVDDTLRDFLDQMPDEVTRPLASEASASPHAVSPSPDGMTKQ